ncbi:MAG: ester cyclase [Candidatus Aminicenantes bacterium]|nr:ester cyclase [Candidatus Aminicenantes bacterium]
MRTKPWSLAGLCLLAVAIIFSGCAKKDPAVKFAPQIEKLLAFWNSGDFTGIEDVLHEDFEMRMSPMFTAEKGIAAFKESVSKTRESYPDFLITVEEGFYSENAAAGRWTIRATGKNGQKMNVMGISMLHFADGKIKDEWISSNDLLWMEQLGYQLLPPASKEDR